MEISRFPWLRVKDRHTFDARESMPELGKQCKANKLDHMTKKRFDGNCKICQG
jgi:hypothetical protein